MSKLIGGFLIITSMLLMGYLPVCRANRRIQLLSQWITLLGRMQAELRTSMPALPILLHALSAETDNLVSKTLHSIALEIEVRGTAEFSPLWKRSIRSTFPAFSEGELAVLTDLGDVLGRYLLEDELKAVHDAQTALQESCTACKVKRQELMKVRVSTAVVMGVTLVVILV